MPVGSLPRWDIINAASEKNYTVLLKDLTKNKLVFFDANEEVEKGFKSLLAFPYKNFPVMQSKNVSGIENKNFPAVPTKKFAGVTSLVRIMEYLLLNRLDPNEHKILKSLVSKI